MGFTPWHRGSLSDPSGSILSQAAVGLAAESFPPDAEGLHPGSIHAGTAGPGSFFFPNNSGHRGLMGKCCGLFGQREEGMSCSNLAEVAFTYCSELSPLLLRRL